MSPFLGDLYLYFKTLKYDPAPRYEVARLREMIVDLFITISLCIKWLNLPGEIFLDSFCSTGMKQVSHSYKSGCRQSKEILVD